ncbi:MAG: sugar phosphate nucleotidyltransferase, partial [Halodesulfurarchaeum sp.]
MVNQVAVILAGGTGTRLYPASRAHRPKQVLAFAGDEPLLRRAADRAGFLDSMYVITSARYRRAVEDLVPEATVLVEPEPRDTGPALVYAAHEIRALEDDPVLLCLPSDHVVGDGFERDARTALRAARETGGLVTLGIQPDRPATEYGYIEPGPVEDGYGPVEAFHEKPDEATAEAYIGEGALWNAGIFAWR